MFDPHEPRDERGRWTLAPGKHAALLKALASEEVPPLQGDSAVAHVAKAAVPLNASETVAVEKYGLGAYMGVNDMLRGEPVTGEGAEGRRERLEGIVAEMDAAIARQGATTLPVELHRYSFTNLDVVEGQTFTDPAFASTSLRADAYGKYANGRQGDLLKIVAPPGTVGLDLNALGLASNRQEHEYLLPRGSRFAIERIDDSGPTRVVHARLLLADE